MTPRDFRGTRALVTGASSGLGRALAEGLVREGARVVLTGRSEDRLRQVVDGLRQAGAQASHMLVVPADLTEPEDRARLLAETAAWHGGAVDLVINSAGVGAYGRFESHEPSVLRAVMELNLFALAELCRGSLPLLRQGRSPVLINIGSIVARRGLPGRSEYSASKFAVAGLTESLRPEWSYDGIHILLVNPGWTATAFEDNAVVDTAFVKTAHRRTRTPEEVARAILRAARRRKNEVTLTAQGNLLLAFNRVLPRFVDWGMARWTRRLYRRYLSTSQPDPNSVRDSAPSGSASERGPLSPARETSTMDPHR